MVKPTGRRLNTEPAKVCSKFYKNIKHYHLYLQVISSCVQPWYMQNTPALDNFDCKRYKSKQSKYNQINS